MTPGEVVVDEEPGGASPLDPCVVQSPDLRERGIRPAALQHDGKRSECLLKITGAKQASVPGKRRVEIVDKILGNNVGISRRKRIQRLRGKSVEQGVDGIGIGGLESVIRLKAEPGRVLLIDVVIDANRLNLFMIRARMRDALTIGTTVSIIRNGGRNSTDIKRTAKYRERRSVRISVERKHLLIERHRLRGGLIDGACDRIGSTQGELLQNVILECRSWDRGGRDNR